MCLVLFRIIPVSLRGGFVIEPPSVHNPDVQLPNHAGAGEYNGDNTLEGMRWDTRCVCCYLPPKLII